jgi:predicted RNase H-like HicB family nuclease
MEKIIKVHVEKLPEGVYLATSDDVQGLVAQGRTLAETMEIARDIAKKLLEEQSFTPAEEIDLNKVGDLPLVVAL